MKPGQMWALRWLATLGIVTASAGSFLHHPTNNNVESTSTYGGEEVVAAGVHDRRENALEFISVKNAVDRLDENKDFLDLKVNATMLEASGEWLQVSWTGVYTPSYWDFVALMVPANASVRTTAPAKYKMTRFAETSPEGTPFLRFRAVNMRQSFRFVLFSGSLQYPVAVSASAEVHWKNPNEPTQGHIALTATQGEMKVQWVTRDAGQPQVQWGLEPDLLSSSVKGDSTTYTRSDLCGEPATSVGWVDPGTMHSSVLTDLLPDTTYYYRYGDKAFGFGSVHSFTTPPAPGPDAEVFLLHVADMGQAEADGSNELSMMAPSLNTSAGLLADLGHHPYRLVLHNGDISYARGYVTQWDVFYDQIAPVATRVPWMTSPGNHERDAPASGDRYEVFDSGGECGVPYELRTGMPHPQPGQQWYSFDYGPIHFLEMSTEQPFEPGSPQFRFIQADLEAVDRTMTPWLIVGGHRPFYVSSTYMGPKDSDISVADDLRAALEDLFLKHQVDMVWNGHHHSYQRSCPMYRSRCHQGTDSARSGGYTAPIYIVAGHAGASLCKFSDDIEDFWQVMDNKEWGYMRIRATGTEMDLEVVRNTDGTLIDEIHLAKSSGSIAMAAEAGDQEFVTAQYL